MKLIVLMPLGYVTRCGGSEVGSVTSKTLKCESKIVGKSTMSLQRGELMQDTCSIKVIFSCFLMVLTRRKCT